MNLIGKVKITGEISTETGLHIGGSKSAIDIGGVDLNVVKTPFGEPFIPGSSHKGKLRSMLARKEGSVAVAPGKGVKEGEKTDEDVPIIIEIFGSSGDSKMKGAVTRLYVRDAFLNTEKFNEKFEDAKDSMEMEYSDVKWENSVDRKTGAAKDPRQMERVPAGAIFKFEIIYDVYNDGKKDEHLKSVCVAMRMLEDDYLGGQGSRGYGKIKYLNVKFVEFSLDYYAGNTKEGTELTAYKIES